MAFTVVYDACVLYPAPLRDLLVRLAQTDVFRARWTDAFVMDLLDLAPGAVLRALTEQAAGLRNPAVSLPDLLTVLETNGLRTSVAECRRRFGLNVPPPESQR